MAANYERFKNITSGIQSLVIAIAVIIGGVWTAYTFRTLGTSERAAFERDKIQFELDKDKADRERQGNYGLDITIEAQQEQLADNDYISASVKITNKGFKNRYVDLTDPPLQVYSVGFNGDGSSAVSYALPLLKQASLAVKEQVLRPETASTIPFLFRVPNKGFYLLLFSVRGSDEDKWIYYQSSAHYLESVGWIGSTYVLVK